MNILTFLDLNNNELRNIRLQVLAVAPPNATLGAIYYNSQMMTVMLLAATGWIDIGGSLRSIVAATGSPLTISVANNVATIGINDVTTTARGAMLASDKAKLDQATNLNTPKTIVQRDANGNIVLNQLNAKVVTGLNAPVNPSDAATKSYVDMAVQGLDSKMNIRCMSDAQTTLSTASILDGVQTVAGDRVLLIGQKNPLQNGIWVVQTGAWTRPLDFATGTNAKSDYCFIQEGTKFKDCGFVCVSDKGTDVVDTHALNWTQFSSAGQILFGKGGTKTGNVLDIISKNAGIRVNDDDIEFIFDPAIFQVDAVKGLMLKDGSITLSKLGTDIFDASIQRVSANGAYGVRGYVPVSGTWVGRMWGFVVNVTGGVPVTQAHPFGHMALQVQFYESVSGARIMVDYTVSASTITINCSASISIRGVVTG
jgi:hypothetical protein